MSDFMIVFIPALMRQSLFLALCLVAVIIAITKFRTHPGIAKLVMAGATLNFAALLASPIVYALVISDSFTNRDRTPESIASAMNTLNIGMSVVMAAGLTLLLVAVFAKRQVPASAGER